MKVSSVAQPKLHSVYARSVKAIVAWLTPGRLKVYPTAIAALTFAAWGVSQALGPGLTDVSKTIIGADFAAFYTGGRFFLSGRLDELYDLSAQKDFQASLVAPVIPRGFTAFINPPFTVVLYAPFAWSSYGLGLLLWWGAGLLALTLSLYLLHRELRPSSQRSIPRLLGLSFLFYPTLAWFLYGQNTAFTLLLYTLTFVMLRRGRDFTAGLTLGLLLYKPQLAIALSVVLLIKRRWRALLGGALSAGLWLGIGFTLSPAAMWEFVRLAPVLPEFGRAWIIHNWGLNSFFGFSSLLLDGFWRAGANLLTTGLTIAGLITIVAWWWRASWQPDTHNWDFRMAATLAVGLLISPHLFLYDLMLLLLPLGIVWGYYWQGAGDRPLDGGALLAWTAILYVVTFVGNYLTAAQQQLSVILGFPKMAVQLGTLVIAGWAWLIARLAQQRR